MLFSAASFSSRAWIATSRSWISAPADPADELLLEQDLFLGQGGKLEEGAAGRASASLVEQDADFFISCKPRFTFATGVASRPVVGLGPGAVAAAAVDSRRRMRRRIRSDSREAPPRARWPLQRVVRWPRVARARPPTANAESMAHPGRLRSWVPEQPVVVAALNSAFSASKGVPMPLINQNGGYLAFPLHHRTNTRKLCNRNSDF